MLSRSFRRDLIHAASLTCLVSGAVGCFGHSFRTSRLVGNFYGVVVSNSVMFLEDPEPRKNDHGGVVDYSFLVEGTGNDQVKFVLTKASAVIGGRETKALCLPRNEPKGDLIVKPGQRERVDCQVQLDSGVVQLLEHNDTIAQLSVPVSHVAGQATLEFDYHLYREELK